jgi:RNA recognition motif-containing protein
MSGTVIIRLQNLPLEARSIDIRRFFDGLVIPDGGVHIIGGEKGDAFIAFHTDEDARQAMARDSYPLCNAKVRLQLSSKTEMMNVISAARNQAAKPIIQQQQLNHNDLLKQALPQSNGSTLNQLDLLKLLSSAQSAAPQPLQTATATSTSVSNILEQLKGSNNISSSATSVLASLRSSLQEKNNFNTPPPPQQQTSQPPPTSSTNFDQILTLLSKHISSNGPQKLQPHSLINLNTPPPIAPPPQQQQQQQPQSYNTSNDSNGNQYEFIKPVEKRENNYNNEYNRQPFNTNGGFALRGNGHSASTPYINKGFNNNEQQNNRFNNNNNNNNPKYNNNNNNNNGRRFNNNNNNNNNEQSNGSSWSNGQNRYQQNDHYNNSPPPSQPSHLSNGNRLMPMRTGGDNMNPLPFIRVQNFNKKNCSYKDIRTFLQGIQIEHDGIQLLNDPLTGQRNGMAFVRLVTITDLKKALCRNGQFYEDNQIQVVQATELEFNNKAISSTAGLQPIYDQPISFQQSYQQKDDEKDGFFIKIYGLPSNFDETSLKNMFNNVKFIKIFTSRPKTVNNNNNNNNSNDGEQQQIVLKAKKICQVETKLDLEKALTRQDERVGKSKLQIFQIGRIEFEREVGNSIEINDTSTDEAEADLVDTSDDNSVFMTGVPFSARDADVRTFFEGVKATVKRVHLLIDETTQKPTGDCCCRFISKEDKERALEKDNNLFRNRVVKIKPINNQKYQEYVAIQLKALSAGNNNNNNNNTSNGSSDKKQNGNYRSKQNEDQNGNSNDRWQRGNNNNNRGNYNNNNGNNRGGNNNYNNRNNNNNNRYGNQKFNNYDNYNDDQQQQQQNGLKRRNDFQNDNGYKRRNTSNNEDYSSSPIANVLPPLPDDLLRYKDSLVLLSNVAQDASREDILELFKIYSPLENTLKIRHDDQGIPTGDAIIACNTREQAEGACQNLNGITFMGSQIRSIAYQQ